MLKSMRLTKAKDEKTKRIEVELQPNLHSKYLVTKQSCLF